MALSNKGFSNTFHFVGKFRPNENSFKINTTSKSGFVYSSMNVGIDCGESGFHFIQSMGGYFGNNPVVTVNLKTDDGYERKKIDWEDRFDDEIVESTTQFSTFSARIELTDDGKPFAKKFVSGYDFVEYCYEHLNEDDIVSVRGTITYREYEGNVTPQYNVNSVTKINSDTYNMSAEFVQSLLITNDCIGNVDDNGYVDINGFVLEYDKEIKGNKALPVTFKYKFPEDDKKAKAQRKLIFNVKDGNVNVVTFVGEFISIYPVVEATADDLTEDIKELIELGLYTEDEIFTQYAGNGKPIKIAVITKPRIYTPKGGTPTVQIIENYCEESELFGVNIIEPCPTSEPMPTDDDDFDLDSLFN